MLYVLKFSYIVLNYNTTCDSQLYSRSFTVTCFNIGCHVLPLGIALYNTNFPFFHDSRVVKLMVFELL